MKQAMQVAEWHKKFNVPISEKVLKDFPRDRIELRNNILLEEVHELYEATKKLNNIDSIADAIGDILYVIMGTACECGLHNYIEEIFDEIHRSNMSKLDETGKPVMRGDGKVLKSKLFNPPNFTNIFPH